MTSLIGYVVHNALTYGRTYSADEQSKMWQHFERLQPDSLLFMDDIDKARQAKKLLPSCIVVHRRWRANDGALHLNTSPSWFYDTYAHDAEGGIVVQCLNEPSGYDKLTQLASWCASVMEKFAAAGLALAVPNFGVGHPDLNKLLDLTVLWEALKKYPQHYYSQHEYGTYRGMTYTDATHSKDVVPWRVGRYKMIVDFVKSRFDYDLPVLITEFGIDSSFYPDDIKEKRGWRDAGITEIEYANQLIKAANEVYNVPSVKGLHIFSHGNTGRRDSESDWRTHDVSFLGDFQRTLEDYSALRGTQTEANPMPMPKPSNASDKKLVILTDAPEGEINVRTGPGEEYRAVGKVKNGERFNIYFTPPVSDRKGRKWFYASVFGIPDDSWVCEVKVNLFVPVENGTTPAPTPTPSADIHTLKAAIPGVDKTANEIKTEIEALQARRKEVEGELTEIDELISAKSHAYARLIDSRKLIEMYISDLLKAS